MATDYAAIYRTMNTPRLVTEAWQQTDDPVLRGHVVAQMQTRGDDAFPSAAMAEREEMAGLYPDYSDPEFAIRLYQKREFHEARAVAAAVGDGTADPCTSAAAEKVFELTPVQRIVSRFLHPSTPYHGMLLFHGVGVGKTCSAVTIAENFLEATPNKKVIVLVPQALQDNFKRTVFDAGKLAWDDATGSWTARQCTGVSYLERLGLTETRDEATIRYKVAEDMRARYTVIGYQAFANWIERTLKKHVPPSLTDMRARAAAENEVLRQLFSDHLIIVDEAHNLRDTGADDAEPAAGVAQAPAGTDAESPVAGEAAENAGGKALNPYLKRIVLNAEGLRLVLMTATPMYNSAPEIVLLLNYLRMNDTKKETSAIRMVDLFDKEGRLLADPRAQRLLERASRAYVSYMRGENPYTFPLRMRPAAASAAPADEWPTVSATSTPVNLTEVREALNAMPLVFTEPVPGSPVDVVLRAATSRAAAGASDSKSAEEESDSKSEEEAKAEAVQKATDVILDYRMQMANITYPNQMFGTAGWNNYFTAARPTVGKRKIRVYLPRTQPEGAFAVDSVFGEDALALHAPKMAKVLASVKAARGICFVYSRYISGGALPMALAFERAGFQRRMADGTLVSLLAGVPAPPPICAICGAAHSGAAGADGHPFRPACYVLLTSEDDISPNFPGLVQQAATWPADPEWGPLGGNVKVVIGSQVASEGLDLKCVREMHVLDSWYHLNRTDQIIGRAIRYCSHSALRAVEERMGLSPMALNNCLIYLHALKPAGFESADMYAYRIAIAKAIRVGEVQRLLKKHAWDCNLELEAITFTGLPGRDQVDAQGRPLTKYSINDVDFTTYCDYRVCEHKCVKAIPAALRIDASTYTAGDARRLLLDKQDLVRRHFDETVMVPETTIQKEYADLPWEISSEALMELLDPRRFRLTRPDGVEGYLLKRAGYLVFQPIAVRATEIPITMRYGRAWQLRRRFLDGTLPVFGRAEEIPLPAPRLARATEAVAVAAVAAGAASAPVAVGTALTDRLVAQWEEWYNYVMAAGTAAAVLPSYMASTMRIWGWILDHYKTVPAATEVALRWWVDRLSYEERRAAMELATIRSAADAGSVGTLVAILEQGLFRTPSMTAYRIYNPETAEVEVWCRSATADAEWTPCSSALRPVIEKRLGNDPVPLSGDSSVAGAIVGFMAPKKGRLVFKTLDTSKIRKQSTVGAECGNVTNLGEHRPRVKLLHEAGRSIASLEPLMLPDDDATHDATGARARMDAGKPIHLNDLTHQPLCAYLEFLARLMDHLRAQRRRWFLGPIEASVSGLRGRK
jgi:hypothetical protein